MSGNVLRKCSAFVSVVSAVPLLDSSCLVLSCDSRVQEYLCVVFAAVRRGRCARRSSFACLIVRSVARNLGLAAILGRSGKLSSTCLSVDSIFLSRLITAFACSCIVNL